MPYADFARHAVWELEEFEIERQQAKDEGGRHRDSPAFKDKAWHLPN